MRILFVNEKCGYFGGVEQNVAVTAHGLRNLGCECFLAYGTEVHRDFSGYSSLFENVFHCKEICEKKDSSPTLSFDEIANTVRPEVIYIHKVPRTDFCVKYVNNIRIVRMVHDHNLCCPKKHKYLFHNSRICHYKAGWRCYLDLAFIERGSGLGNGFKYVSISDRIYEMRQNYRWDCLLTGSVFMRQELVQNGFPPDKIHILPPSVPMKPINVTQPSKEPNILCVSQLIRGKGVDLLLQAVKKIGSRFHLTIVGTGNAEAGLKELSHSLGLDDRVRFAGWVNNDSIGEFYSNARVVAVPCRWPEPFGMIGLEAMWHARPVVAFNVGGIPDWLENDVTGFLVAEQDVSGLATAIERILQDYGLAQRLGEAALIRAHDKFSFEKYLEQTREYLKLN